MGTIVTKNFQTRKLFVQTEFARIFLFFALLINLFYFCFKALTFADSFRTLSALLLLSSNW